MGNTLATARNSTKSLTLVDCLQAPQREQISCVSQSAQIIGLNYDMSRLVAATSTNAIELHNMSERYGWPIYWVCSTIISLQGHKKDLPFLKPSVKQS